MQFVVGACAPAVGETLGRQFDVGDCAGVEELAQFLRAEEFVQQVTVERQRGRTAFGQRRIPLVHVCRDPIEEKALGEGRRLRCVDSDDLDPT